MTVHNAPPFVHIMHGGGIFTAERNTDAPLRDVFAAQGIAAVLLAIAVPVLNLFAPELLRELLAALHGIADASPELAALWEKLRDAAAAWLS